MIHKLFKYLPKLKTIGIIIALVITLLGIFLPQTAQAWDSYTKLMLHMNGADESTTFTDEIGHTFTAYGNAQLDTAQKKFGTASGLFGGTGDYIDTPDHADFTLGSGEFTLDFQLQINELPAGVASFVGHYDSGLGTYAYGAIIHNSGDLVVWIFDEDGETYAVAFIESALAANGFYHIEFSRANNYDSGNDYLLLFINGVLGDTAICEGITVLNADGNFYFGGDPNGGTYLNGWTDEFRLSVGICRHTENFTPPTEEYSSEPSISNTPDYWTIGTVQENTSYWANGLAPTFPLASDNCTFSVTNDSSVPIDISIKATNFTGGNGWTLTSGSPGSGTVRLLAFKSGDAITDNVTLTTSDQPFITNLAADGTMMWELLLQTGVFTDGVSKSDNVTLTSTVAD